MKKYQLEVNKEQLDVIQESLEFFSRFLAGQTNYIPTSLETWLWKKWDTDEYCKRRGYWDFNFDQISHQMFDLTPNASMGIGNPDLSESAKIAYDLYRPILELRNKEYREANPDKDTWNVYSSPGLSYSKCGRISIKTIEE